MEKTQRITLICLIIIGLLCLALMVPPNLTGAETPEMLEVFEVDEYAQYPHLIRMLTPGDTPYQTIRNFTVYLHYYYGYPFYFWSAVSAFTVRHQSTRLIVCVLRECLSVLPMVLAAGILTWTGTRFRKVLPAVILDIFLLTMPAVISNNFWWHPDSLTLLFLSLVFFFLDRDEHRCGRNFFLAAAACGCAFGTKYLGVYFVLAIPLYLLCCRLSLGEFLRKAALFVFVAAAFVVISNPLLLLPQERAEIIDTFRRQTVLTGSGVFLKYDAAFLEDGHLPRWLTENYAHSGLLLLSAAALFAGVFRKKRLTLAAYLLAALLITFGAAARRLHYFLPILLPFFALSLPELSELFEGNARKLITGLLCLLLGAQILVNLKTDVGLYQTQIRREADSGAIRVYRELEAALPLPEVPAERMTRVFRDWKMYFPEQAGYVVKTDWEMATQVLMDEWRPDLILLESANIREFSDPACVENAVDPASMRPIQAFYAAARVNEIPGYSRMIEDAYGLVFRRDSDER